MDTSKASKEIEFSGLTPTTTPFGNIGLAFSGGGYRAASFALGTLSYLQNLQFDGKTLLQNVSYISSASGGTITNAVYSLSVARGKDFGVFYKKLFEDIEGIKILNRVFENLNNPSAWKDCPEKRRNIINSFALAYDKLLFEGETAGSLQHGKEGHLDEVCFNTTEFYRGLLFRQAIKLKEDKLDDETFLYGNFIIHLKNGAESLLKLGDLLAASSCFPAGFEPILFPDDFIHNDSNDQKKSKLLENLCIELQEVNWDELKLLYEEKDIEDLLKDFPKPIDLVAFSEKSKKFSLRKDFKAGFMDGE